MHKRTMLILGGVIAIVAAGGLYLAPSNKEIALMKLEDSGYSEAFGHYSELYAGGDHSIDVLVPLISLHVHYGDMDKAIALLEGYLAQHPRSVAGLKRLVDLYKSAQRPYSYSDALAALQALEPTTQGWRELADVYDFLGRYEDEMHALAELIARRDYHPREDDYVKLASFYRVDRQLPKALEVLTTLLDIRDYRVGIDAIKLAVQLALDVDKSRDALEIAQAYMARNPQESGVIVLSGIFRVKGRPDDAYTLLVPFLANAAHSRDLLEEVAGVQLARGKEKEVYDMLMERFGDGELPESLAAALGDLAMKFKNHAAVEAVIKTADIQAMPEDALLRYAGLAIELKLPQVARLMQERLGREYLREAPLLSAMLRLGVSDTPQAFAALRAVPASEIALPERKKMVAVIFLRGGDSKSAYELLKPIPASELLTILDATQFATLFLEAGMVDHGYKILKESGAIGTLRPRVEQAQFMLDVGQGKTESALRWVKAHPQTPAAFYADAYVVAARYRHSRLAVTMAEQAYQVEPSAQTRKQLAEALLQDHRYADAIGHLHVLVKQNPEARRLYIYAMTDWIRKAGVDALGANRAAMEGMLDSVLQRADMSLDEKRGLGYLLAEAGFRDRAEAILMELASNQPFHSNDVNELLGFWGERLTPDAAAWIERRARNAAGAEKVAWLAHLNATGNAANVVAALGGNAEGLSPLIMDEYIGALVALHETARLGDALAREIAQESNTARLEQLSRTARGENLQDIAQKGWKKLYDLAPDNKEALKGMGLSAFAAYRYTEAQRYLEKYLKSNKADYQVNTAYAEILQHKRKKESAQTYFAEAEKQVSEIKEKDVSVLLAQAHLLYKNNRVKEAMDLYRSLLVRYPDNKTVRADFAEMLIAAKQFEEASLVLKH